MNRQLPAFIVVADRGHVIAYKRDGADSTYRQIESTQIEEGLQKLSEQVTDKAGAFPNVATAGKGNSSAERLSLEAEIEATSHRKAAEAIQTLFADEQPSSWAFAAPPASNKAIIDKLPPALKDRLQINLPLNLTNMPVQQVVKHFAKKAEDPVPISASGH